MLVYDMEKRGKLSLYDYLYQCLKNDILMGEIKANEKLPSKRSLAKQLNVSVITVENAYEQLILEGYIRSIEKKGYFVQKIQITKKSERKELMDHYEEKPDDDYQFFGNLRANGMTREVFPFSTWAKIMRNVLSSRDTELLMPVPYNGLYDLRAAIADFLRRYRGMNVVPSQVVIGSGTGELYSRLLSLLGPGGIWAVEEVGNHKLTALYDLYHVNWQYIEMDEDGLRVDALMKSRCNVAHVAAAGNFPTGHIMRVARRQELLRWAEKDENYIIEDDYDYEYRSYSKSIPTIYSMDRNGKVIYMNTFYKTLIPSLRISYMVLPYALIERMKESLNFYSGSVSSIEQLTLSRFISDGYFERHLNHMRNYYRTVLDAMLCEIKNSPLAELSEVFVTGTRTCFILGLQTQAKDSEIRELLRAADIEVSFFSEYTAENTDDSHRMVVNYSGVYKERIPEIIRRIYTLVLEVNEKMC